MGHFASNPYEGRKEGENHISEPTALITLLKNTAIVGLKVESSKRSLSTDVQTRPIPALVTEDVRTLYGSDEEYDEIFDEELV